MKMTYTELATDAIDVAVNANSDTSDARWMTRANAYATLALVEQQRIANLLTFATFAESPSYEAIVAQAQEALGIK